MKNIQVKILNPEAVADAERMAVAAARLTQRGATIRSMSDLEDLLSRSYSPDTVIGLADLPHPTLQKLGVINVAVVGASRRFLAQVTRHQNEVKFISASLQYSDYSGKAAFAIPYNVLSAGADVVEDYQLACARALSEYERAIEDGLDHDSAGYMMPQGLRNVLLISATPYQWKHMIRQRTCRRNTDETRIVFLEIWAALFQLSPQLFSIYTTGPFCNGSQGCQEGRMSCCAPYCLPPTAVLRADYPALFEGEV